MSYTATGKVRITAQLASTSKTNTSSFALKANDEYIACDQDDTALVGIMDRGLKKVFGADGSDPIASTLYENSEMENVYFVYGSCDGIIVSWTVDASEIEGGLKVSLLSPDTGTGRGVRVLSLTIKSLE